MSETVLALTHALSMPHARRNLDDFLETALIQKWSPTQVLEAFLTTEADGRAAIGLKRRFGIVGIPENKTFDTFDTQPHTPAILRPDRPRHPFHPFVYVALIIDLPPARFNHPTLSFQARVIRV